MIYSIKRFSALDETKTFSYKHLRLESKLFGGMRGFYRKQAQTITNPPNYKPGPDNRTQAQKDAILKANGISVPSALDRGIAGFERGMTSLGTSMGKGITAVGSVLGKAGSAVGQGASAVGRGVQSGATSVGQALGNAGTSTGKAIQTAGRGIGRAAQSVGSGISGAFQSVGNFFRGKPKTAQTTTPQTQPASTPSPGGTQTPATSAPRPSIMSGIRNFFSGKPKTEVQKAADIRHSDKGRRAKVKAMKDVRERAQRNGLKLDVQIAADDRHSEKGRRQRILQQRSNWEREKEAKRQSAASIATKPASTPQQSTAQTATNPAQSVTAQSGSTGETQQTQPGRVGQWFKNAGQNTWNGVKTAGKIGMIGGTAAAGLGAYALYKTATSDSDD